MFKKQNKYLLKSWYEKIDETILSCDEILNRDVVDIDIIKNNYIETFRHYHILQKDCIIISFKDFETYYNLNPNMWLLSDYCVSRLEENKYGVDPMTRAYKQAFNEKIYKHYDFMFEYKEWKKYQQWLYKKIKEFKQDKINKEQKQLNSKMIDFLKIMQKDIDNLLEQSDNEIEEARKTTKMVANNLGVNL